VEPVRREIWPPNLWGIKNFTSTFVHKNHHTSLKFYIGPHKKAQSFRARLIGMLTLRTTQTISASAASLHKRNTPRFNKHYNQHRIVAMKSPVRFFSPKKKNNTTSTHIGNSSSEKTSPTSSPTPSAQPLYSEDTMRKRNEKQMSVNEAKDIFTKTLHGKMSLETAELIARNFEDIGITTSRDLRKTVLKQNLKLIAFEALALVFNVGVTVAIYSVFVLSGSPGWEPGGSELVSQGIAFGLFIAAGIFSVESVAHTVVLGSFLYSLFYFSFANLNDFTKAMHVLAIDQASDTMFQGIRRAVSATRVLQKLTTIKQAIIADPQLADENFLSAMPEIQRLSAFFELKNAIDEHGFSYKKHGLTEERAMVLASLFSEVDEDSDGKIDESELRKLLGEMSKNEHVDWTTLGADFKVAFKLLDVDGTGTISLDNFCEWLSEPEKKKKASEKSSPR